MADEEFKKVSCDNCDWTGTDEDKADEDGFRPVYRMSKLTERVGPGEEMPAGECPECGCCCHHVEDEEPVTTPDTTGAALAVAMAGLSSLARALNGLPAAPLTSHLDPIKTQSTALLSRLGAMCQPNPDCVALLGEIMRECTIQEVIKAYAVHHPDAVATPEQVEAADGLHAGDEISVDAEAFVSPVPGEGFHIMGWLWVAEESEDEDGESA